MEKSKKFPRYLKLCRKSLDNRLRMWQVSW
jgi:hypothetical protein